MSFVAVLWLCGALGLSWVAEQWLAELRKEAPEDQGCVTCHPVGASALRWELANSIRWRGECPTCGARLPTAVWLLPLLLSICGGMSEARDLFQVSHELLFCWALLLLAIIDWHTMWIDYRIVVLTLTLHVGATLWAAPVQLATTLQGALFGAGGLYLLGVVYEAVRQRQGLGDGDPAVLALIGAWTGAELLPFVVLSAALSGSVVGGWWLWRQPQRAHDTPIPFAPFLCLGGLLTHWGLPQWTLQSLG